MFKTLTEQTTLEGLKKEYRKLAKKYHPDHFGGDGSKFIELQSLFENLFNKLEKNDKDAWAHKNQTPSQFMELIEKLMQFSDLEIEQIGAWLYVTGQGTFKAKEELKALKFWWSSKHRAWIYSGEQGKTQRKATKINPRQFYGSEKIASTGKGKQTLYIK